MHPDAVITHPCEFRGTYFSVGDVVYDHEAGHRLVHLGFAEYPSPVPPAGEPVAPSDDDTPGRKAARPKE